MSESEINPPAPLVIKFELAKIAHLNIRKQGEGSAIDLKLHGVTSFECLPRILGCSLEDALQLWKMSQEALVDYLVDGTMPKKVNPRFTGMDGINTWAEFENCELFVEMRELPFRGVKIKKFRFMPTDDLRIILDVSCSITNVSHSELCLFADRLQEEIACRFEGQPELPLDDAKRPAKVRREDQTDFFDDLG